MDELVLIIKLVQLITYIAKLIASVVDSCKKLRKKSKKKPTSFT